MAFDTAADVDRVSFAAVSGQNASTLSEDAGAAGLEVLAVSPPDGRYCTLQVKACKVSSDKQDHQRLRT